MTLFFISAALLVALCLVLLLAGLFKTKNLSLDQEAVNITLARERRATLDAAIADGSIDQNSYDYERSQLEHDLASDLQSDKKKKPSKGGHISAAIVVALFVPITAGALYLHLGNPAALTQDRNTAITSPTQSNAPVQAVQQAPALAEILPNLEERLAASPDDVDGWRLLGRSYLSINDFTKAKAAFEKAAALDDTHVPTLAQLAEAIAMSRNGDLTGEATALLERANTIDSSNEHTLWLLSIARQQVGDHEAALKGFNQLANMSADNPEALATIEEMRGLSVREMALSNDPDNEPNDSEKESSNEPLANSSANTSAITVNVDLTPEAKAAVDANHAVFIYAKASAGPPMPLAVSRHTVAELPLSITLDDSMAMIPAMTLSSFADIIVGARVSPSGNAIAQSGDWFVEINDVDRNNADLILMINQQVP